LSADGGVLGRTNRAAAVSIMAATECVTQRRDSGDSSQPAEANVGSTGGRASTCDQVDPGRSLHFRICSGSTAGGLDLRVLLAAGGL
jgi:hypothetical protein